MTLLSKHHSNDLVKALIIGNSKAGKTGSLVSLVKAGYWLGILDMDNLLDPLKYHILRECPDKIDQVDYITLRDNYKASRQGPIIEGIPSAFTEALRVLTDWPGHGSPSEWGPERVLVIDSLSRFCDAGHAFHEYLMSSRTGGKFDNRQVYGINQKAVEKVLANLSGPAFNTNVLVICHILYVDMPDGTKKGFPQSDGQALSPKIPTYFPTTLLYENKGGKRTIQTTSTPLIDLANPKPFAISASYPIETGLADIFALLREPPTTTPNKATISQLRRRA